MDHDAASPTPSWPSGGRRPGRGRESPARLLEGADLDARPEGYYLWLRLPEPWRRDTFAAVLRARGVALTPAEAFAVGRAPAPHAVRLCVGAARSRKELRRGLGLVADVLRGAGEAGAAVV